MQLTKIDDPRDNLAKMTRDELVMYAAAHGIEFPNVDSILRDDPTSLGRPNMIQMLREKGLRGVDMSERVLGQPEPRPEAPFIQSRPVAPPPKPTEQDVRNANIKEIRAIGEMTIQELRRECKERGIALERTDNIAKLRAKLNGQNAA